MTLSDIRAKSIFKNHTKLVLMFVVGMLFYCYEFFLRLLTGAYEKQIVAYFSIKSHIGFSFLISSYNITYLIMQVPAGLLIDRFGSRIVLTLATFLCGAGNLLFIAGDYSMALAGRFLVGFGSSFAFVGVLKISREYLPSKYFAFFSSIVIALGTLAAAFSQQVSVYFLSIDVPWTIIFFVAGVIAVPLSCLFYLSLCMEKCTESNVMWTSGVRSQLRALLKTAAIWWNGCWAGLLYIPTVILTAQYGVSYFQTLYKVSAYRATELITDLLFGWVFFSPIISFISSKTNSVRLCLVFSASCVLILLYLLTYRPTMMQQYVSLGVFLLGAFSASQVLVWQVFHEVYPKQLSGLGIALTNMIITAVTEVGQLSSGGLLDLYHNFPLVRNLAHINYPMQFDAILFFVSTVLALFIFCGFYKGRQS